MRNRLIRNRDFSRRALLLGAAKLALLSSLGGRLYYLQVAQAEKYKTLADGNRIRLFPILPPRGRILDRYGNIIAEGKKRHQLLFSSQDKEADKKILQKIMGLLEVPPEEQEDFQGKLLDAKTKSSLILRKDLSWEEVAKLEVNIPDLPGVSIATPEVRYYHSAEIMSHITGYTGSVSEEEIGDNPLRRHPDYRIGKNGIEKIFEEKLKGSAGIEQIEVDARGRHIRVLETKEADRGNDVRLTIDVELQNFIAKKLAGKGGLGVEGASAIVMDVHSGDVLSMVSVPSYDSNRFIGGVSHNYWNSLLKSPDSPLINKAIGMQYPPGSTFKTMVALAALEAGVVTPETAVYCPGHYDYGDRRFHCWDRNGHGKVKLDKALYQSCNIYFYKLSTKLGVDRIAAMARKFGFGSLSGIELPGEKPGLVPDKAWKKATLGKPWYGGETLNASIGQGYMLATPLQLAVMTARLASLGKKVTPRIAFETVSDTYNSSGYKTMMLDSGEKIFLPEKSRDFGNIDVSAENIRYILDGMRKVINDPAGAGYKHRLKEGGYSFGGKTGTAQVVSNRTFDFAPEKKTEQYHALFIGFAPVDKPRYVTSVVVEHGGYGSVMATPIAREILLKVQQLEEVS